LETQRERDKQLETQRLADAAAEAPILEALKKIGVNVNSVWDLVNAPNNYDHAGALLLAHLRKPYPESTREGLARALAIPSSNAFWKELVALYAREEGVRAKEALALAVANSTTEGELGDVERLARDESLGRSRVLLIQAFRRARSSEARAALTRLREDPMLQREADAILAIGAGRGGR
jgi:hypothetical protein